MNGKQQGLRVCAQCGRSLLTKRGKLRFDFVTFVASNGKSLSIAVCKGGCK